MTMLPKLLDAIVFFRKKDSELKGQIEFNQLQRLNAVVESAKNIDIILRRQSDEFQDNLLYGEIKTELLVICQNCQKPFSFPIDITFIWAIVKNDQEAKQVQKQYEPVILEASGTLDLYQVLEDEILLALPLNFKHPNAVECDFKDTSKSAQPIEKKEKSPFSELSQLKKKLQKDN